MYSTKTFVIPVICFSILYNISKFFELDVIEEKTFTLPNGTILYASTLDNETLNKYEENMNVTYILQPTKLRLDSMYITIYILWMNLIFNILGPFLLLATLNHIVSMKNSADLNETNNKVTIILEIGEKSWVESFIFSRCKNPCKRFPPPWKSYWNIKECRNVCWRDKKLNFATKIENIRFRSVKYFLNSILTKTHKTFTYLEFLRQESWIQFKSAFFKGL